MEAYIFTVINLLHKTVSLKFSHKNNLYMSKQGCHFTSKNLELDNLGKITWNLRIFEQNLEKPVIFINFSMFNSKISIWHKKFIIYLRFFVIIKNFLLKSTEEVILQYLFNVFILINTVSYIKLKFKLKIDPNICTLNTRKKILKKSGNFDINTKKSIK